MSPESDPGKLHSKTMFIKRHIDEDLDDAEIDKRWVLCMDMHYVLVFPYSCGLVFRLMAFTSIKRLLQISDGENAHAKCRSYTGTPTTLRHFTSPATKQRLSARRTMMILSTSMTRSCSRRKFSSDPRLRKPLL
jgi:hypothetical protein